MIIPPGRFALLIVRCGMRFKISKSVDGQYYFEIQAGGNYATLATSETYKRPDKRDVLEAIELIRGEAGNAEVVDAAD